jgi:dihydroflavonol-4-reductase
MKVFLTGATGFVGHHVAHALAAQGADLRLLVRKTSNLKNLEGIRGETHVGDLLEPESLRPRWKAAMLFSMWRPTTGSGFRDPAAMYRANVDGTRELLRMAREAGVPRVVYTSSRRHHALPPRRPGHQ